MRFIQFTAKKRRLQFDKFFATQDVDIDAIDPDSIDPDAQQDMEHPVQCHHW